jgi:hypothetical protein
MRSVIALFDGGTPKKFDATDRLILVRRAAAAASCAYAANEDEIKIAAAVRIGMHRFALLLNMVCPLPRFT